MSIDLSWGSLVNAGSAMLFLATGVAVIALARGRAEVRLLGATLASWGLYYVLAHLTAQDVLGAVLTTGASAVLLVCAFVLPWRYPARASRPLGLRLGVVLALCLLWLAWALWGDLRNWQGLLGFVLTPRGPGLPTALGLTAIAFLPSAFALRALAKPADAAILAPLTLVFGLYSAYNSARIIVMLIEGGVGVLPGAVAFVGLTLLPAPIWLAVGERGGPPRLARNTALGVTAAGVLGAGLAAVLGATEASQYGVPGALRTVSWGILAVAILRHGLLKRELPRIAVSRGPLAAGALATLFIVAQVAQEFLAAEYGLLMGGVIAGALLFAASPIQRAMERTSERGAAGRRIEVAPVDSVRAYRAAVRAALEDGAMTPRKEEHLADVAEHLGLGPRDALRIRREVEEEAHA